MAMKRSDTCRDKHLVCSVWPSISTRMKVVGDPARQTVDRSVARPVSVGKKKDEFAK